jgi:hypothetical protein
VEGVSDERKIDTGKNCRSHRLRPWREIMKNTRLGGRRAVSLASAAAALASAFILTVMTAAAATVNATDVTIRNSPEDKSDYSNAIGVLNQGDKVTVISKTTDSAGTEWYNVELENGNRGYVKAQ